MRHPLSLSRPFALLLASVSLATALPALAVDAQEHRGNQPAHVHGVGRLDVALEGNTLTLHLDSPLINLVGFEHAANSSNDKEAVRTMANTLREATRMFVTEPAAQCKLAEVQLESAALAPALLGEKEPAEANAAPQDGHADLDGDFTLVCASPGALNVIDVTPLLRAFPGFQRIDVQLATPKKQGAFQLVPGNALIPLQ